ncbi:GreA/GreB family elongation factor [Antarcticibacterium flavum]|uniref:GreA/GreB family elongation factor n=1 Tax=Antarcticibacterium flavum TaxID=2058175 RepID=A0A5B7WY27_9FLAO|nr:MULTISPECIES: GreA/GreB family elongation factor [Antarcticibacterium]MCM4161830.1 transcription elongation factor [Antarcticibacterium sp. W02-3]QCY67947.1 GreA/GreB family elongation factor [Antarcticibacterium flavum]
MANRKIQAFYKSLEKIQDLIDKYQDKMDTIRESMEANDVHTDYDEEGSKGELLGDFERYATHLDHAQKMKQTLNRVDREHYSESIKFGSMVETDDHYYFIAVPLGNITLDDGSGVSVISTEAPIYQHLEGKKKGDSFTLKDKEVEILDVH